MANGGIYFPEIYKLPTVFPEIVEMSPNAGTKILQIAII